MVSVFASVFLLLLGPGQFCFPGRWFWRFRWFRAASFLWGAWCCAPNFSYRDNFVQKKKRKGLGDNGPHQDQTKHHKTKPPRVDTRANTTKRNHRQTQTNPGPPSPGWSALPFGQGLRYLARRAALSFRGEIPGRRYPLWA